MQTRDQVYATRSFEIVKKRRDEKLTEMKDPEKKAKKQKELDEYKSFAKRFPTLIHTCGLMQALAFAQNKNMDVLNDFVSVLKNAEELPQVFIEGCQKMEMSEYMKKSRFAMLAAGWIKRQADALIEDKKKAAKGGGDASNTQ